MSCQACCMNITAPVVQVRPFSALPKKRPAFQAPPIKRRKGPSSRGGQAMTIDMFMEKEDDSSRQSR